MVPGIVVQLCWLSGFGVAPSLPSGRVRVVPVLLSGFAPCPRAGLYRPTHTVVHG